MEKMVFDVGAWLEGSGVPGIAEECVKVWKCGRWFVYSSTNHPSPQQPAHLLGMTPQKLN